MNVEFASAPVAADAIVLPPVLTVDLVAASVAGAVEVRRLRCSERLTGSEAASAVSVVGIRLSAPLRIIRLRTAAVSSASKTTPRIRPLSSMMVPE